MGECVVARKVRDVSGDRFTPRIVRYRLVRRKLPLLDFGTSRPLFLLFLTLCVEAGGSVKMGKSRKKSLLMKALRLRGMAQPQRRKVEGILPEYYALAEGERDCKDVVRLDPSPPPSPAKAKTKAPFASCSRPTQRERVHEAVLSALGCLGDAKGLEVTLSVHCPTSTTVATVSGEGKVEVRWKSAKGGPAADADDSDAMLRVAVGDVRGCRSTNGTQRLLQELGGVVPRHHRLATKMLAMLATSVVSLVHHAGLNTMTLSLVAVLKYLYGCGALATVANDGVVDVVVSGDGFASSSRQGAVAVSARVLGLDTWLKEHGFNAMEGVVTLAYFAGTESSHTVSSVHKLLMDDLEQVANGFDVGDGTILRATITLCSDGKWLSNSLGLTGGNAKMGCPWCSTNTHEMHDDEYVQNFARNFTAPEGCHSRCAVNCHGQRRSCISPCKTIRNCNGSHGFKRMTPIAHLIGRLISVVPDLLHLKLRLVEKLADLLRRLLSNLYRTVRGKTIEETNAAMTMLGSSIFAYPPFAVQKKLRFHGDIADKFLKCGAELLLALRAEGFTTCDLRPLSLVVDLLGDLETVIRSAFRGPADGIDVDVYGAELSRLCMQFSADYVHVMGSESKPLYLHILRHHLAPLAKKYSGLGNYCCEKVEKLNLILRRAISNRCGGGNVQFHTMRWAMTMAYILGRSDLIPTVRAYKQRRSSGDGGDIADCSGDFEDDDDDDDDHDDGNGGGGGGGGGQHVTSRRGTKRHRPSFAELSQAAATEQ